MFFFLVPLLAFEQRKSYKMCILVYALVMPTKNLNVFTMNSVTVPTPTDLYLATTHCLVELYFIISSFT